MKFASILLLTFFAVFAQADETCVFGPPCPIPPTQADILAVDKMFTKVRYALGAAFAAKNKKYYGEGYKNIPDYLYKTKNLRHDLSVLDTKAQQLNLQAGAGILQVAIRQMMVCVGSYADSDQCSFSLVLLKDFRWEREFGTLWAGYPINKPWDGFPDEMK